MISRRLFLCAFVVSTFAISSAYGQPCDRILKGEKAQTFKLAEYRSPQLVEAIEKLREMEREIRSLKNKLESSDASDFWGFYLEYAEKSPAARSPEKRAEVKKKIADLKFKIKKLEGLIEELKEKNRLSLIPVLKERLAVPEDRGFFEDYKQILEVYRLPRSKLVSVLVGSSDRAPTDTEATKYERLVAQLVAKNYTIIYDADNKAAEIIARAAGPRGIGISMLPEAGARNESGRPGIVLHFNNSYSFLEVVSHALPAIVSPDSTLGMAALLNNDAGFVLDLDGNTKNRLHDWSRLLESEKRGFGISYRRLGITNSISAIVNATRVLESVRYSVFPAVKDPVNLKAFSISPNNMSLGEIIALLEHVDVTRSGVRVLSGVRGAAVFGSSRLDEQVAPDTYQTAYWFGSRGIPVVTGGAGGVMYAANMGAFDAGGPSIGIPRVGRGALPYETDTRSDVQSHTVPTLDYHSRIPLLVDNRDLVIVEPGGNGTMRELAATLVAIQYSKRPPYVVIQNSKYYSHLLKFITNSSLSPEIKSHILVADSAEKVASVVEELESQKKVEIERSLVNPRSDRHEFPKDEFERMDAEE